MSRAWLAYVILLVFASALVVRPGGVEAKPETLPGVVLGSPTVVVAFQRRDCAANSTTLTAWNEVHGSGPEVVGILIGEADPAAAAQFGKEIGLIFPLRPDPRRRGERFLLELGYKATPIVVAIDAAGRVRHAAQWNDVEGERIVDETRRIAASLFTPLLPAPLH